MKKLNIISILAIVCAMLLIIMAGLYFFSKKDFKNQPTGNEVQKIKDLNKDVVGNSNKIKTKEVRKIDNRDHIRGKLDAKVQLIVYSDFECPFCSKYTDILKKVEETFGDKVVISFRHYPLRSHADAVPAAIASECAGEQGKFWEMHDRLFQDAKKNALGTIKYKEDAKDLGLDQVKFNKCLDMEKYKDVITASQIEAKEFGVNGTPASFVNGEPAPGAVPFEDFTDSAGKNREGLKSIIERHLK